MLEAVTPLVALTVESAWVVNLPLSAVIVTVLPEILPTARVSPVAVSVTPPDLDSIPPLMSPVLAFTFTLPVVVLMVVPVLVVTSPANAVIFTVLLEVMLLFTVTFFALIAKPVLLSPLFSVLLPPLDISTLLFSVTLWSPAEIFESLTLLKVTALASAPLLPSLLLPIVKSLPFLAVISALSKPEMFRSFTSFNSLVLMVRLA
ncbi:hypothetical protein BV157_00832 [Haemophilus influenzae]|nr:hypothetical protein BV157_00832 [Haemophilus influenzae]